MKCPYCHNKAAFVPNEVVYGTRYGKSYMCYWCKDCDAYVGTHNNTKRALGTMANKELREWRRRVHEAIDPLWKSGEMTRPGVYKFLEMTFHRPVHVGESNIEQCQEILSVVAKLAPIANPAPLGV